jgi:hypothetical protein
VAVGLGTVDMPVPSVAEWEWLNWKFPRPVHAGETIYARWTLTQKRPPVGGAPSSIVVWRVDVHTADGALCAEGEVGAKVRRAATPAARPEVSDGAPAAAPAPRRRRRRSRANGTAAVEPPAIAAPPAAEAKPERTSGGSRRRRRRRTAGSAGRDEEHEPRAAHVQETAPEPATAAPPTTSPTNPRGLTGVLRRLRRP